MTRALLLLSLSGCGLFSGTQLPADRTGDANDPRVASTVRVVDAGLQACDMAHVDVLETSCDADACISVLRADDVSKVLRCDAFQSVKAAGAWGFPAAVPEPQVRMLVVRQGGALSSQAAEDDATAIADAAFARYQ